MTTPAVPDEGFAVSASEDAVLRAAEALREHGSTVEVAGTVAEARKLVNDLLPTDKTIYTSASETLRLSGITADIDESGRFISLRKQLRDAGVEQDMEKLRTVATTPEVVIGSVHAVTEQGQVVIASASGSQLAPYAAGAGQVIWVVGTQKIVPDLDTALNRIRTYCLPKENERCMQVYGQPSVLSKILIVEREIFPGRITVVLVREPIGF